MANITLDLQHHGILGQKWGVRRSEAQLGSGSGKSKTKSKDTAETKNESTSSGHSGNSSSSGTKKSVKEMTDEELQKKIDRLGLEKRYSELSKTGNTQETSRGKKFVTDVLEDIGKKTLTNLGTQAANHFLGNAINKIGGVDSSDATRRIVNPQKGQTDKK